MSGQPYEVIAWRDGALVLLDQTLLPHRVESVRIDSLDVNGASHGPLLVVSHDTGFGRGDGLLGRDFLDQFLVTIDNAAGVVTLAPR